MAKWDGMLAALWLLRSRRRLTAAQMAEELGVSVRTVYRYIDALCMSGVPVCGEPGHGGGYYLAAGGWDPPLFFDEAELTALVHAARFAQEAGYPFGGELERALEKIRLRLSESQRFQLERRAAGFEVIANHDHGPLQPVLRRLQEAVAAHETLRIAYRKAGAGTPQVREVDPYGLVYRDDRWYVMGYCHLRRDLRTFRADRILELHPAGRTFRQPEDFALRRHLSPEREREMVQAPPTVVVRIGGDDGVLQQLAEHRYLRHGLLDRGQGEIRFRLNAAAAFRHLPAVLLGYGTRLELLEPRALRREIEELARSVARHYGRRQVP